MLLQVTAAEAQLESEQQVPTETQAALSSWLRSLGLGNFAVMTGLPAQYHC